MIYDSIGVLQMVVEGFRLVGRFIGGYFMDGELSRGRSLLYILDWWF